MNMQSQGVQHLLAEMGSALQILLERHKQDQEFRQQQEAGDLARIRALTEQALDKAAHDDALIRQLKYQRDAALASEQAAVMAREAAETQERAGAAEAEKWKLRYKLTDRERRKAEAESEQYLIYAKDMFRRLQDAQLKLLLKGEEAVCPQCGKKLSCDHCGVNHAL